MDRLIVKKIAEYKTGNLIKLFIQLQDGFAIGNEELESKKISCLQDIESQNINALIFRIKEFKYAKINWMNTLSIKIENLKPEIDLSRESRTDKIEEKFFTER